MEKHKHNVITPIPLVAVSFPAVLIKAHVGQINASEICILGLE